ncbi:MAG: EF-hand domain-containing protein [Dokdonella sp.]
MNLYKSTLLAGALMCLTAPAFAHDMMHSHMAAMDTNGDGMISKDEFMNHMQAKWDKLPKNKDGMVMMKDMEMMHHDKMMKHHEMMKDDKMKDMNGGG